MTTPSRVARTPSQEEIAKTLSKLCTNALRGWWILEQGRLLLGLDCVRARAAAGATDEHDYADALREYLEDAVQEVESPQYRVILEVVLGLGAWKSTEWRDRKATERRAEAGRRFRSGEKGASVENVAAVTGGTIRQHHEPRAIKALAEIIWRDEKTARGESDSLAASA